MKKLLLVVLLLAGLNFYSQDYNLQKRELEKQLQEEFKKNYDEQDITKIKEIREKIAYLNKKSKVNRNVKPETTNTYVINYDFKTGFFEDNNMPIKVYNPVVFKIKNINRLIYDVTVKSKDSILADSNFNESGAAIVEKQNENTTSDAIKVQIQNAISAISPPRLLVEDFKNIKGIDIPNVYKETQNKIALGNKATEISRLKTDITIIDIKTSNNANDLENLKNVQTSLKAEIITKKDQETDELFEARDKDHKKEINEVTKKINELTQNDKDIAEEKVKKQAELVQLQEQVDKQATAEKNAIDNFVADNTKLVELFGKFQIAYYNLLRINKYSNELKEASSNTILTCDQYKSKYKFNLDKITKDFSNLIDEANKFSTLYFNFEQQHLALITNWELADILNSGGRNKLFVTGDNLKKAADAMKAEIDRLDISNFVHLMKMNIDLLENDDTFEFVSSPVQPTNDVVVFEIDIKKRNQDNPEYHNNRKFNHKEYTYGGMRLDFGIGLALGYFDNAPVYGINTNAIGGNILVKESENSYFPSVAGMATASIRRTKIVTYGLSLGVGLSVEDGRIQTNNFYFGPSLIVGKFERLAFTSGVTIKNVKELKEGYAIGQTLTTNDIASYTRDFYKLGLFFSLTYNLTKGVKNNLKYIKK